jgi:hypothetical protein
MTAIALKRAPGWATLFADCRKFSQRRRRRGSSAQNLVLRCAKMRLGPSSRNFVLAGMPETKLTARRSGVSFYFGSDGFA